MIIDEMNFLQYYVPLLLTPMLLETSTFSVNVLCRIIFCAFLFFFCIDAILICSTYSLQVQDLHSITPDSFLEVSGGVIHPLSYQQVGWSFLFLLSKRYSKILEVLFIYFFSYLCSMNKRKHTNTHARNLGIW